MVAIRIPTESRGELGYPMHVAMPLLAAARWAVAWRSTCARWDRRAPAERLVSLVCLDSRDYLRVRTGTAPTHGRGEGGQSPALTNGVSGLCSGTSVGKR